MMEVTPAKGYQFDYESVWYNMQVNGGSNQQWQEYPADQYAQSSWWTNDLLICCNWWYSGGFRIAYSSWLHKHNLLDESGSGPAAHAPVEDGGKVPSKSKKSLGQKM
jgi:hypothetical protein